MRLLALQDLCKQIKQRPAGEMEEEEEEEERAGTNERFSVQI